MVFRPGIDPVPASGMVLDGRDLSNAHDAVNQIFSTNETRGVWVDCFERALEEKFLKRFALFCNSGSSANLLALASLELPKGSEVITCVTGFPTTINPIIQLGLTPVFVDCEIGTWNIEAHKLWMARTDKTRAVMISHTLGNPANMYVIGEFVKRHKLRLIEDCCDAAGASHKGNLVGSWGDLSTYSFYPAHQITTFEGGAVLTDDPKLSKAVASFRDWGRDCWCDPGHDDTCGKRFAGDYDHKYTYSRLGYNLKQTGLHAAVGVSQLVRLDEFVEKREENWCYLYEGLMDLEGLTLSEIPHSFPSWFGFAFGVEKRNELARYLDRHKIGNRPLFAGNILRQPAYASLNCSGCFPNADYVHEHVLWVGCWPGLTREMLDYTTEVIHDFFA